MLRSRMAISVLVIILVSTSQNTKAGLRFDSLDDCMLNIYDSSDYSNILVNLNKITGMKYKVTSGKNNPNKIEKIKLF